MSVSLMDSRTT